MLHSFRIGFTAVCTLSALLFLAGCENKPVAEQALDATRGYSDVEGVALEVGQPAPTFTLTSMEDKPFSLDDLNGKAAIVIFYRGYWCPYCIGHLEDVQALLPELDDLGVQVVAVSPDDVSGLKRMAKRLKTPYLFLSDPDLVVAESYGIRRDDKLPHPAVIILDAKGVVQWFYVGEDYKQRPSATQLRQVINRIVANETSD